MSSDVQSICCLCGEARRASTGHLPLHSLLHCQEDEEIGPGLFQMLGLEQVDSTGQLVCEICCNRIISFKGFVLNCRRQRCLKKTIQNEGPKPENKTPSTSTEPNDGAELDISISNSNEDTCLNSDFLDNLLDSATFKGDSGNGGLQYQNTSHNVVSPVPNCIRPCISNSESLRLLSPPDICLNVPVSQNQSEPSVLSSVHTTVTSNIHLASEAHQHIHATGDITSQGFKGSSSNEPFGKVYSQQLSQFNDIYLERDPEESTSETSMPTIENSTQDTVNKQVPVNVSEKVDLAHLQLVSENVHSSVTFPPGTVILQKPGGGTVYILPDGTTLDVAQEESPVSRFSISDKDGVIAQSQKYVHKQQNSQPTSPHTLMKTFLAPIGQNSDPTDRTRIFYSEVNARKPYETQDDPTKVQAQSLNTLTQLQKLTTGKTKTGNQRQRTRRAQNLIDLTYAVQGQALVHKCQIGEPMKLLTPPAVNRKGQLAIPRLTKPARLPVLPILLPKTGSPVWDYRCPKCKILFVNNTDLQSHVKIHADIEHCPVCQRPFISTEDLYQHLRDGHPAHICNIDQCNYYSGKVYAVKNHMNLHSQKKNYHCNQCNKSFKTQTYLKQHKIRCHSSRKATVECPLCDKRFKWQVSLKYHLRFHKQGYHECSECEKKFQFEESLRRHILAIHEEVAIHRCEVCGKRFADNHTKTNHWKTHFKDKYKVFHCSAPGCTFREYNEYRVKAHILKVHEKVLPSRVRKNVDQGLCDQCGVTVMSLGRHLRSGSCSLPAPSSQTDGADVHVDQTLNQRIAAEKMIHNYRILLERTNPGDTAEFGQIQRNSMSLADLQNTIGKLRERLIHPEGVCDQSLVSNDAVQMEVEVETQAFPCEDMTELAPEAPPDDETFVPYVVESEEVVPACGQSSQHTLDRPEHLNVTVNGAAGASGMSVIQVIDGTNLFTVS